MKSTKINEDEKESIKNVRIDKKYPKFNNIIELDVELEGDEKDYLFPTIENALKYCKSEEELATYIKERYDETYNPNWGCIVGMLINNYR